MRSGLCFCAGCAFAQDIGYPAIVMFGPISTPKDSISSITAHRISDCVISCF
jgi:hypothetical protein